MNYIPRGDGPTRSIPPRNICDFCDRRVVVCCSTEGKGYWGAWINRQNKITGYFHSACMDASGRHGAGGAV